MISLNKIELPFLILQGSDLCAGGDCSLIIVSHRKGRVELHRENK
jgi:hypothetical protein